jgi:hypothetical protein
MSMPGTACREIIGIEYQSISDMATARDRPLNPHVSDMATARDRPFNPPVIDMATGRDRPFKPPVSNMATAMWVKLPRTLVEIWTSSLKHV